MNKKMETRVQEWVVSRIGPAHMASNERAMRLLEESIELAQAEGISFQSVIKQVEHVYGRPPGDPTQEAAGAAVCLFAWCAATKNNLYGLAEKEIKRIESKPLNEIHGSVARKTGEGLVVTEGASA